MSRSWLHPMGYVRVYIDRHVVKTGVTRVVRGPETRSVQHCAVFEEKAF